MRRKEANLSLSLSCRSVHLGHPKKVITHYPTR
jgi:hypothetical protein